MCIDLGLTSLGCVRVCVCEYMFMLRSTCVSLLLDREGCDCRTERFGCHVMLAVVCFMVVSFNRVSAAVDVMW